MRLKNYGEMPNAIIRDKDLTPNGKLILTALLLAARQDGIVKGATVRSLAHVCHRDKGTVTKHLQELEHKGYIAKFRRYRYSLTLGCPVYDSNLYWLTLPSEGGYTLIPRSILQTRVTGSAFAVMLYLYMCAGREGRAYPSIRHIAGSRKDESEGCGVSKASVCRALALLKKLKFIIKLACQTVRGKLCCNSYLPTGIVPGKIRVLQPALCTADQGDLPFSTACLDSGLKNRTHLPTNKITRNFILRKSKKGVFNYSTLYKYLDRFAGFCAGIFSGIFRPRCKDTS